MVGEASQARLYLQQAAELCQQGRYYHGIFISLSMYGELEFIEKQYQKAIDFHSLALEQSRWTENFPGMISSLFTEDNLHDCKILWS